MKQRSRRWVLATSLLSMACGSGASPPASEDAQSAADAAAPRVDARPDAAPSDARANPTPPHDATSADADGPPAPDAGRPDAASPPEPDVFVPPPPEPDAFVPPPPEPDAFMPPPPACVLPDAPPPRGFRIDAPPPPVPPGEPVASTPIATDRLAAYYPLDGDFRDASGHGRDLTPVRDGGFSVADYPRGDENVCYGPTGATVDNGARLEQFNALDGAQGVTLEGWFVFPSNASAGNLIGFGNGEWNVPKLHVSADWGNLSVAMGSGPQRRYVRYGRYGDRCWPHVALVLPPGLAAAADPTWRLYVDGVRSLPPGGDSEALRPELFDGAGFRLGAFNGLDDAGSMRLDEVRVWERAVSEAEIATLATARGAGARCAPVPWPAWAPGPRHAPPAGEVLPDERLEVRVLTPDTLVVVSDPSDWVRERIVVENGAFLAAMEANRDLLPDWLAGKHSLAATMETLADWKPRLLDAMRRPDHLTLARAEGDRCDTLSPVTTVVWPGPMRELWVPPITPDTPPVHTHRADLAYFTYVTLPEPLQAGGHYEMRTAFGHAVAFTYDPDETHSWLFKVNQVGYGLAGPKRGYLGGYVPTEGPLDLTRFIGAPFTVRLAETGAVAYDGVVTLRSDPPPGAPNPDGEQVLELDFTALDRAGRYVLHVDGVGRSWPFTVGDDAVGEMLYVHARGLFHQRCAPLDPEHTAWPRGDIHTVYQGGFPPDWREDAANHAAQGWGFLDANGAWVRYDRVFDVVAATATAVALPQIRGGWHDAGDFDRNPAHMKTMSDLLHAYLARPEAFEDGQFGLPESGNGLPDLLDEALWGVESLLTAQDVAGGVGTYLEATSHPVEGDAGLDTQPYYRSLPTRDATLDFVAIAALAARAVDVAGDAARRDRLLDAARLGWRYAHDPAVRVETSFTDAQGRVVTWREAPQPNAARRLWAAVQLRLAEPLDPEWAATLDEPGFAAVLADELAQLRDRNLGFAAADVAAAPELFPPGFGETARTRLLDEARLWRDRQATHAYRRPWYRTDENQFAGMGWGNHHNQGALRAFAAAYALTGETDWRDGLVEAIDWLHGANPQGVVMTTGLGHRHLGTLLHNPAEADAIDDPPPGITLYGYTGGIPYQFRTHVHGVFEGEMADVRYPGVAHALLPPPADDPATSLNDVGAYLYAEMPGWRRLALLEHALVISAEFTVHETMGPYLAAIAALMPPGWQPPDALRRRGPRSPDAARANLWVMP